MDLYWFGEEGVFDTLTNPHSSKGNSCRGKKFGISVVNGLGESSVSIIERGYNFMKRVEISLQVTRLIQNAINETMEGSQTKWIYTDC